MGGSEAATEVVLNFAVVSSTIADRYNATRIELDIQTITIVDINEITNYSTIVRYKKSSALIDQGNRVKTTRYHTIPKRERDACLGMARAE